MTALMLEGYPSLPLWPSAASPPSTMRFTSIRQSWAILCKNRTAARASSCTIETMLMALSGVFVTKSMEIWLTGICR
eukprot:CAMPEP_0181530276 /NCGR_PEP_ID=MMETSP1110-20121109/71496_1 /TAXON_ID=174948 /ORGANISM="Symbiodinium sp., Strain CCMP421" /LENGTH=76 /DNA_ID=CAMNT_0023661299 /DNA_START=476 /DNA_END=706 /DNA_ORIENTATION=+